MKQPNKRLNHPLFVAGELYLFHPTDCSCPAETSLWGIYDKTEDDIIYLESFSFDLRRFYIWSSLPANYQYSRQATREELRDYMYNMGHFDARRECLHMRGR